MRNVDRAPIHSVHEYVFITSKEHSEINICLVAVNLVNLDYYKVCYLLKYVNDLYVVFIYLIISCYETL